MARSMAIRQIRNKLLAPTNQDKLNYLATNKNVNSQDLIDQLQQEKTMGDNKNPIRGNSLTAERLAAQQMMTPDPGQTMLAGPRAPTAHTSCPASSLSRSGSSISLRPSRPPPTAGPARRWLR